MNKMNAQQKFQSMFTDIIKSVEQKHNLTDCLNQAFNFIYTNYSIYEHDCLLDRQMLISDHLQWLIDLNKRLISIESACKYIQIRCIVLAYEQSSYIEKQSFNPDVSNPYSLNIINDLVYLNKIILSQKFDDYCNNQVEIKRLRVHPNRHVNLFRKVIDVVGNSFGRDKESIDSDIQTYHFQKQIRQEIKEQRCSTTNPQIVDDNDMILQMSKCFQRLVDIVIKEIEEGQINSENMQKIIGDIHNIIIAINIELRPFNLVLS